LRKRFVFFYTLLGIVIIITLNIYDKDLDKNDTKPNVEQKVYEEKEEKEEIYNDSKIIKVKLTDKNEIVEMTVNEYLKGVVPAEMPPDYNMEALKSQAIVARTYLYQKMSSSAHKDCDICDNYMHCQAYYTYEKLMRAWERTKKYDKQTREKYYAKVCEAVDKTDGIVVTYNGKCIKAFFHASSPGKTESAYEIWGEQNISYLRSVDSIEDKSYKYYETEVKVSLSELEMKINKSLSKECSIGENEENAVDILSYTDSGRVKNVKIGGKIYKATELRTALGLRSTNFTVEQRGNVVVFDVKGNGHGIGMSQVGANYLAKQGETYEEIIKHYYTGVELTEM
jgi:stage II sporulation protein D